METLDRLARPLRDLRISVTDRCNFRCGYCMPEEVYTWIDRREILTFEEIGRLARLFVGLGAEKIRLTGGEPLVRRNLNVLVSRLAGINGLRDICLTTNGAFLAEQAGALKSAGLKRVTVSLDTLDPQKFQKITQRGELAPVLAGIAAAQAAGFNPVKINAVVERGVNDDEIPDIVRFCRERGLVLRFIEFMDVGNTNQWTSARLVPKTEILDRIHRAFPIRVKNLGPRSADPAVSYEFEDGGGEIGVVGSVTEPFCSTCTRARLTPDGRLVTCLFSAVGVDLKTPMRAGASDEDLTGMIRRVWNARTDRYSDERLEFMRSPRGYDPAGRRKIEMITLGG